MIKHPILIFFNVISIQLTFENICVFGITEMKDQNGLRIFHN